MHAAAPWFVTRDDHEADNNYAGLTPEEKAVNRIPFAQRRANAYKAYYEQIPLRRASLPNGPDMQLYRRAQFGRLAEFFVLDTRQFRTDQPYGDGRKPAGPELMNPEAPHRATGCSKVWKNLPATGIRLRNSKWWREWIAPKVKPSSTTWINGTATRWIGGVY
jgi:phosphodiesterase/alkaline phosphatase D-like protein